MNDKMKRPMTVTDCRKLTAVFMATWLFCSTILFLSLFETALPSWAAVIIGIALSLLLGLLLLLVYHAALEENRVLRDMMLDKPDRKFTKAEVKERMGLLRVRPMEAREWV